MASDGRLETRWTPSLACSSISAKKVLSRRSVTTTDSTLTPRSSSRSFMRSWVIGRGVVTSSRANAMAVASAPPMKIGSTRWSPVRSRSSTMGVLRGELDPDADELHLDHRSAPYRSRRSGSRARRAPSTCRSGSAASGEAVGAPEPVEVAVPPGEVEAVADDEHVRHLEPDVVDLDGQEPPDRPVDQGRHLQRRRLGAARARRAGSRG